MKVENTQLENGDLEIVLTFDSHEQKCLEHDLLDIVEWYSLGPSREKISNCMKRMIKDNRDALMASPEMQSKTVQEMNLIMNDEKLLIEEIAKLPNYKNRAQREAEIESQRLDA